MTERVRKLREQSMHAVPTLSPERAVLVTEFYRSCDRHPAPITRALAFKTILERKKVVINDGELIVGERGPGPKATSTYPELCCHSPEDMTLLNSREKIRFAVDPETRAIYEHDIIPFWKGRTIRERIFGSMSEEWRNAYEAGVFTEFMEQRAPGHTVLDDKIYRKGMRDFIRQIDERIRKVSDLGEPEGEKQCEELNAMRMCAEAIIAFANRYADEARALAEKEVDARRRDELLTIEKNCRSVPANAPSTFWQALQYYWFVHLGVITELNPWDAFNPGRLDQHLYPFYVHDRDSGNLSGESARELLQCFWVKFNNQPAPPKVGVTAAESSTYTDFANINVGGLTPDGSDGVNELSYLILDVIDEMRLVQPSSNIQLSRKNPDDCAKHACRIIRKGWGQPSVFSADTIVEELVRQGKSVEDARSGGASGCVETGAFGKEAYILTGYFNLPKVLEITLHNGLDPRSGKLLGIPTGDPSTFGSFEDLMDAFRKQVNHFIDVKIRGNNVIERIFAESMPVPFLSILIDDCIENGRDYNNGGARYNTSYIQGVGLGTMTDSLSSIRFHVFEEKTMSLTGLLSILGSDFNGYEKTRLLLLNKTPRYGNDDDRPDRIARDIFEIFFCAVDGKRNMRGGTYRINLLPTTCHIYFGSVTGATPDGRKAGSPLSEGISPVQGADRLGPTAVLKSASKIDHTRTGGTLLNQKFSPSVLDGERGIENIVHLIRTYFALGGHHIQFNVVNRDTLRQAQEHPEEHRDLIVRVAGYSDYFCDLGKTLQDEIIARTEHTTF